jgi:hypothetical protein
MDMGNVAGRSKITDFWSGKKGFIFCDDQVKDLPLREPSFSIHIKPTPDNLSTQIN